MSMCFVFALETPDQMFFNAPLLSQYIGGTTNSPVTSLWSCIRHPAFRVASEQATYSVLVVEVATSNCFFDCQSIGRPYARKK